MYYFCLCKSIKELFFELLPHLSARKRMQRYTILANLQNFSSIFFRKSVIFTFFMESNECQRALHLIIYNIGGCGGTGVRRHEISTMTLYLYGNLAPPRHRTTAPPHHRKLHYSSRIKKIKTVYLFCDFFVLLQSKSYRWPGAARLLQ